MDCAPDYTFDEIVEGFELVEPYQIDETAHRALTSVFRDCSPLHVDEQYARACGFAGRVMHGAILNAFLSHFVGMRFPGKRALLLSTHINYHRPAYLGDEILLSARVSRKVEAARVLVLQVKFIHRVSEIVLASGKVQIAVRE